MRQMLHPEVILWNQNNHTASISCCRCSDPTNTIASLRAASQTIAACQRSCPPTNKKKPASFRATSSLTTTRRRSRTSSSPSTRRRRIIRCSTASRTTHPRKNSIRPMSPRSSRKRSSATLWSSRGRSRARRIKIIPTNQGTTPRGTSSSPQKKPQTRSTSAAPPKKTSSLRSTKSSWTHSPSPHFSSTTKGTFPSVPSLKIKTTIKKSMSSITLGRRSRPSHRTWMGQCQAICRCRFQSNMQAITASGANCPSIQRRMEGSNTTPRLISWKLIGWKR